MFYQEATLRNSYFIRHLFEIILQFHKIRPFPALWGYYTGRLFRFKSPTWSPIWASWVGDQIGHLSARVIAQIGLFLPQPGGCRSDQKLTDNVWLLVGPISCREASGSRLWSSRQSDWIAFIHFSLNIAILKKEWHPRNQEAHTSILILNTASLSCKLRF